MSDLRSLVRTHLLSRIPVGVRRRGKLSPLVRSVYDAVFAGGSAVERGPVAFEGLRFTFAAPPKTLRHAQNGGVEAQICRLAMAHARPGAVLLDVGANYGFVTSVMAATAAAAGGGARVVSFEADPAVYPVTRRTLEENGVAGVATLVHAFVGAAHSAHANGGARRVSVDGMVEELGLERVDFIKIDVDGAELDILRGAERTLARFQPVVVAELNRDIPEIVDLLRRHGYECGDNHGAPVDPARWPANVFAGPGRIPAVPPRGAFARAEGEKS